MCNFRFIKPSRVQKRHILLSHVQLTQSQYNHPKKNPIQLPKHRQTQHITHTRKKNPEPFKFHHFSTLKQKPNVKTAKRGRIIITGADSAHVPKRDNSSPIRLYAILSPKLKASGGHGSKFANSNGGVKY